MPHRGVGPPFDQFLATAEAVAHARPEVELGRRPAVLGEEGRGATSRHAGSGGSSSDEAELPIAVVAGTWITITLILFGVMSAALAVGLMTALGGALWHNWPRLGPRPHAAHDDQQVMVVTRTPDCPRRPNGRVSCDRR